jgi:hypothetical protein
MRRETILMVLLQQKLLNNSSIIMEIQFYYHSTTKLSILFSNRETMPSYCSQTKLMQAQLLLKPLLLLLVHSKIGLSLPTPSQMMELDYSTDLLNTLVPAQPTFQISCSMTKQVEMANTDMMVKLLLMESEHF